ncbi:phosphoribosylformylglycinamidine cyclo-ligase [Exiguobacterium sp. Helios]|uniref:phosphoribosylformylglycinamidine cyclo-ligase n=1 Tax=unclassified Exiguobacterium TaxID=2644629 RepID=UPI00103E62BC|nr:MULTISPECIES: phosphoribosylformylglycinamidine cyclo-ligase [unclassified Exiguobacterium]QNR20099.1 phosphoribosylformylglycinamidine cyclo-ligase [Exiguobacterium sp. Helios]
MSKQYEAAGVSLTAGYESVSRMKKHVARSMRKEVMTGLGSFGAMFDLSQLNLKEPVLVSGTDGVGTKLKLAFALDQHDTIGIDCVAMCVNDIIVQGAEPLYFLDYIALGKAIPAKIERIVAGVAEGCVQSGCTLIGGETAEMPGMYADGEYDIAGFAVGAVEKQKLITGEHVQPGDVILGLASSGVHSNGFSLVRKIVAESGLRYEDELMMFGSTIGNTLLMPTRIYVEAVKAALETEKIQAMVHITGGGFYENVPRVLPEGCGATFDPKKWPTLPVFDWLEQAGNVPRHDMYNVFNMGIGYMMIVKPEDVDAVTARLARENETVYTIGTVTGEPGVRIHGVDQ